MLNVVDEFTRECLAIRVARKLGSADVMDVLADLFIARGIPAHIRSDNGPEFVATAVKGWIRGVGAKTAYIDPPPAFHQLRWRNLSAGSARQPVGERLCGKLQRQAARRTAQQRGVQHTC
jgi:Integrase core domain